MRYIAETVRRNVIDAAYGQVRKAAGSNELVSRSEQKALSPDMALAAERAREAKGRGARIDVDDVVAAYAGYVSDTFATVNTRGLDQLSAKETKSIGDSSLRQNVLDVRAAMKAGLPDDTQRGTDGLYRRQLSERYVHDGNDAIKVAFFDADSTLRVSRSGSVSANGPEDVALLPFVGQKLAQLRDDGYLVVVVSNQAGVESGYVTLNDADDALQYTVDQIRAAGGDVHYVDFAEARDDYRKPNPGMALQLEAALKEKFGPDAHIDRSTSIMVGDSAYKSSDTRPDGTPGSNFSNSDRRFAENLGITFHEPQSFFGWEGFGVEGFEKIDALEAFWQQLGRSPSP